jgi:undecaprenyl-diphosphatase
MLEKIIEIDKNSFLFLYNLGSEQFDSFWLIITQKLSWTPFFIFILFLFQKKLGWKNLGFFLLFLGALILISDQTASFFKNHFHRLRPYFDTSFVDVIRTLKHEPGRYSFFSGHATNSMATATFGFLILKNYYNRPYWLFLFPIIFAYSRIYLGLHYPLDILTGYAFGATYGFVFYKLYSKYILKLN